MTCTSPWRRRALLPAGVALALAVGACTTTPETGSSATTTTAAPAASPTTTASGRTSTTGGRRSTTTTEEAGTDPSTSSGAGDEVAACDLLTEQDVRDALGEPVVAGDQRRDECWWSTADDLKTVNLIRRTGDLEDWRKGYQNDQWEPVDLGDEGYAGKVLHSIVWREGETTYDLNVVFSTKGDPDQVVQDLAAAVIGRL